MPGSDLRIGFLGAGRMATALARGWVAAGLATPERVLASDVRYRFVIDTQSLR